MRGTGTDPRTGKGADPRTEHPKTKSETVRVSSARPVLACCAGFFFFWCCSPGLVRSCSCAGFLLLRRCSLGSVFPCSFLRSWPPRGCSWFLVRLLALSWLPVFCIVNRRLVLGTEIVSFEVGKFPRASSSSAGRPRQVAADRAGAGEKF